MYFSVSVVILNKILTSIMVKKTVKMNYQKKDIVSKLNLKYARVYIVVLF